MENITIYIVVGLGCKFENFEKIEEEYKFIYNFFSEIKKERIKIRCPKTTSALYNITRTYCNLPPLKQSFFVKSLMEEVLEDAKTGNDVYVFGFSYGGAIVNRMAELIHDMNIEKNNTLGQPNIMMATFGSIYFAKKDKVRSVSILNYISIGDVAFLCNKFVGRLRFEDLTYAIYFSNETNKYCTLQPPTFPIQNGDVIQLCIHQDGKPLCQHENPSVSKWNEHNKYTDFIIIIIYLKSNNIYPIGIETTDFLSDFVFIGKDSNFNVSTHSQEEGLEEEEKEELLVRVPQKEKERTSSKGIIKKEGSSRRTSHKQEQGTNITSFSRRSIGEASRKTSKNIEKQSGRPKQPQPSTIPGI